LPDQKIKEHFGLEKGSTVYLIGGKQIGKTGKIEDIAGDVLKLKLHNGDIVETAKRYAFMIGVSKPSIKIEKEDKKAKSE